MYYKVEGSSRAPVPFIKWVHQFQDVKRWFILSGLILSIVIFFNVYTPVALQEIPGDRRDLNLLDQTIGYDAMYVRDLFSLMGASGRRAYMLINIVDLVIFPVLLFTWMGVTSLIGTEDNMRPPLQADGLFWAFIYMMADITENICIFALLHSYPVIPSFLVPLSSLLTLVKFLMIAYSMVIVGVRVVRYTRGYVQGRKDL
eukprot:TRINITY_DN10318_c0_g1_i2.p2 TRINITY_DN10318_c0_g1~~TRINITY_DN10318_c0_g1_i2.p2  ORF type:complete len:201 (+),score=59.04 TRINITY_DN10318_c0_g1_i2:21-623(+)